MTAIRISVALLLVLGTCRGGRTLADAKHDAGVTVQADPGEPVVCEEHEDGFACLSHQGDAYCPRSPLASCYVVDYWGPQVAP